MSSRFRVLDLFSGAGGMSFGFHAHEAFRVVGAVDAQNGKPSSGKGTLECNKSYQANIGVTPMEADLGAVSPGEIAEYLRKTSGDDRVNVLISCAPCTGFSRTIRQNLVVDDNRNSLVRRSVEFVEYFQPDVFLMENVGELLNGKFASHFHSVVEGFAKLGYVTHGAVHSLNKFGLPQRRKRALVIACKTPQFRMRTMEDLWEGYEVAVEATTVRRAIGDLKPLAAGEVNETDPCHASPSFSEHGLRRLELTPKDGGDWPELLKVLGGEKYLIPSMQRYVDQGKVGPYRDVYGRMWWDKPSVTLKRECSHTGNGRYAHPSQNRLCSVREMACVQGFPKDYKFVADSLGNMYRHIGDAVPPMISFQIAHIANWILTSTRPDITEIVLPNTSLSTKDIIASKSPMSEQIKMA